jgi:hypothetical protein
MFARRLLRDTGSQFIDDLLFAKASAAYSLRRLYSSYTGNALTLRRSQDNAETDIGFLPNGDLDSSALLNHVGYENLLVRSEEFNNVSWGLLPSSSETITVNAINAPNGALTADLATVTLAGSVRSQGITGVTAGQTVTLSVHLKRGTVGDWARVGVFSAILPSNQFRAWVNLATGTVGTANATGTATLTSSSITALSDGWYRVAITGFITGVSDYAVVIANADGDNNANRTIGHNRYMWGAQASTGAAIQPYQQTVATAWISLNGAVVTWYDQSGNGNNVTQTTASSQPLLVDGGVLQTQGGKPALRFNGTTSSLLNTTTSLPVGSSARTMNVVYKPETTVGTNAICGQGTIITPATGSWFLLQSRQGPPTGNPYFAGFSRDLTDSQAPTLDAKIASVTFDSTTLALFRNGTQFASSARTLNTSGTGFFIGVSPLNTEWANMLIQEITFFPSVLSDNDRQLLESNQGQYFGITVI